MSDDTEEAKISEIKFIGMFEPTMQLRWYADKDSLYMELQQLWVNIHNGITEWRTVEKVTD